MRLLLLFDIVDLLLIDLTSADGASLNVGNLVLDDASVLIFGTLSGHEPIPMYADQMESVVTPVDSHKVNSVRKALAFLVPFFTELFKAYSASALHGVIVLCKHLSHSLVQVVKDTRIIFLFLSGLSQFCQSKIEKILVSVGL